MFWSPGRAENYPFRVWPISASVAFPSARPWLVWHGAHLSAPPTASQRQASSMPSPTPFLSPKSTKCSPNDVDPDDRERSSLTERFIFSESLFWRAAGSVAPQSQSPCGYAPSSRVLPAARQNLAHSFPIYEMG